MTLFEMKKIYKIITGEEENGLGVLSRDGNIIGLYNIDNHAGYWASVDKRGKIGRINIINEKLTDDEKADAEIMIAEFLKKKLITPDYIPEALYEFNKDDRRSLHCQSSIEGFKKTNINIDRIAFTAYTLDSYDIMHEEEAYMEYTDSINEAEELLKTYRVNFHILYNCILFGKINTEARKRRARITLNCDYDKYHGTSQMTDVMSAYGRNSFDVLNYRYEEPAGEDFDDETKAAAKEILSHAQNCRFSDIHMHAIDKCYYYQN